MLSNLKQALLRSLFTPLKPETWTFLKRSTKDIEVDRCPQARNGSGLLRIIGLFIQKHVLYTVFIICIFICDF